MANRRTRRHLNATLKGEVARAAALPLPRAPDLILIVLLGALIAWPVAEFGWFPGGDAVMAAYWADRLEESGRLPDYDEALTFFRLPSDFATPALHVQLFAVHAAIALPYADTIVWNVYALTAATALLIVASARRLLPLAAGVPVLVLYMASPVFLRYHELPGYHYQNMVGDVLLLTLIVALVAFLAEGKRGALVLAGLAGTAIPFTHQLTAFITAAILLGATLFLAILTPSVLSARVRQNVPLVVLAGVLFVGILASLPSVLLDQAASIYTTSPTYRDNLPKLDARLGRAFGISLVAGATAGLGIAAVKAMSRRDSKAAQYGFLLAWAGMIVLLLFGPAYNLNVEPYRNIKYLAAPAALLGGLAILVMFQRPVLILLVCLVPMAEGYNIMEYEIDNLHRSPEASHLDSAVLSASAWTGAHVADRLVLVDAAHLLRLEWIFLDRPVLTHVSSYNLDTLQRNAIGEPDSPEQQLVYEARRDADAFLENGAEPTPMTELGISIVIAPHTSPILGGRPIDRIYDGAGVVAYDFTHLRAREATA